MTNPSPKAETQEEELPFDCPNCGRKFGWDDNAPAIIFLGIVDSVPFNNQSTPCCGYVISGYITRDLEMVLTPTPGDRKKDNE